MRIWIDVLDASDNKLGDGPILTARRFRSTRKLDRAGTFSFGMPAADERAALPTSKRRVACYGLVDGAVAELGGGIVDKGETRTGRDATQLEISGDDRLRELANRSIGSLEVFDWVDDSPANASELQGGSTIVELTNALDGNPSTYDTVNLKISLGDYLYIGNGSRFKNIAFTLGTAKNNNAATLNAQYFNGTGWAALSITDGTAVAGAPFAQSGTISYTLPTSWATTAHGGVTQYWLRIQPSVDLDNVDMCEIEAEVAGPTAAALATIIARAPAGWGLDLVNGYSSTADAVYLNFAGESVLEALIRLAEQTGEHFRLGAGKTVTWLRSDTPDSGVRLIRGGDPVALEGNDAVGLILSLRRTVDSYDRCSRVYPYGAGIGPARVSLASCDQTPPAGYTLSTSSNYLRHDATETAIGRIDRVIAVKDIVPQDSDPVHDVEAANALYEYALAYLARHKDAHESYSLEIAALRTELLPGQTVRVVYREVVDGYTAVDIDADLIILAATTEVDGDGLRTVALQVATVDEWPASDAELLARNLQAVTQFQSHSQLVSGGSVVAVGSGATGDYVERGGDTMTGALAWQQSGAVVAIVNADGSAEFSAVQAGAVDLETHAHGPSDGGTVAHGNLSGLATGDEHTQYLHIAGTRGLTANWDAGAFGITADLFDADSEFRIGGVTVLEVPETDSIFVGATGNAGFSGSRATLIGRLAGASLTSGAYNTFIGPEAGRYCLGGAYNTFIGPLAGRDNTSGNYNVAIGSLAAQENETGSNNVFIGRNAGYSCGTAPEYNVVIGASAGVQLESSFNAIVGALAGDALTSGQRNSLLGYGALGSAVDGSYNVAAGFSAGASLVSGNYNVLLGYQAGYNETGSYRLHIHAGAATNTPLAYGEFDGGLTVHAQAAAKVALTAKAYASATAHVQNWVESDDSYLAYLTADGALWARELRVQTLVAEDVLATIGGHVVVAPTTKLTADAASTDTTIYVEHNSLAANDVLLLQKQGQVEYLLVTAGPAGTGPYSYTVTRDYEASGTAHDWLVGDAVVNTGTTGDGFMDLFSAGGLAGETGPALVGNVRTGAGYDAWSEAFAVGNLDGAYGQTSAVYGVGIGQYSAGNYLLALPSGIRIYSNSLLVVDIDDNGDFTFGQVATDKANLFWDQSDGRLNFRGGSAGTVVQAYVDTDGSIIAGGGDVTINADGVEFLVDTTFVDEATIKWSDGTNRVAQIASLANSGDSSTEMGLYLYPEGGGASVSYIWLSSSPFGGGDTITLSTGDYVSVTADEIRLHGETHFDGAVVVERGASEYAGLIPLDAETDIAAGSAVTLTSSYQTVATSGSISLPVCRVVLIANVGVQCTSYSAAQDITVNLLDDSTVVDTKIATMQAVWQRENLTLIAIVDVATAASHTFSVQAKKADSNNTVASVAAATEILWLVLA